MSNDSRLDADCAVIGAGPGGLAAALALAAEGLSVVVAAPAFEAGRAAADTRTIALLGGSVELFRNLGVWPAIAPFAAPVAGIRLIDDRGGLLRAPETLFRSAEIERSEFGFNVPAGQLVAALDAAVQGAWSASPPPVHAEHGFAMTWGRPGGGEPQIARSGVPPPPTPPHKGEGSRTIEILDTPAVVEIVPAADHIEIVTQRGTRRRVRLVVGADGRGSLARAAAGIAVEQWDYPQAAVTAVFGHARPHRSVSTEFHGLSGPLTTVPLAGNRSGLVWVEAPDQAKTLAEIDAPAFARALEARLQGLLGRIGEVGPRARFPLSGLKAKAMAARRIALVGEAAHAFPPIGAQGLNLGLRDVAVLAELAGDARRTGEDPGGAAVLTAYDTARAGDVAARTWGVHWLNQTLLVGAFPVQAARGIGLHVLANSDAARRAAMRQGLGGLGPVPRLMRAG